MTETSEQNDVAVPVSSRVVDAIGTRAGQIAAAAFRWWRSVPSDPLEVLRAYRSPLAHLTRTPMPESGARVERWTMVDARGETFTALWRPGLPREGQPPGTKLWTVVLLGGFYMGDKVAMLLPDGLHANALAVDWPWKREGERRLTRWQFIKAVPEIQEAMMRSPATLALGVDALLTQPEADPDRIALVGASLGVPTTLAAFELTSAPTAAALVHGAADIKAWMIHEVLRRRVRASVVPAFTTLAFELTRALEPSLHREAASRARMLIINAREDQFVPVPLAEALQRLFPHAVVRWKEGRHVAGRQTSAVLDALAIEIDHWLNEL